MANRYWVGGTGTFNNAATTNWSAAAAITFTASCIGTALTTTGSPALVAGMTVWSNNNTSLGTIVSGAGNAWVVTVGGTYASQGMTAATAGASAPTTSDSVFFTATSSLVSYTVTTGTSPSCLALTMSGPASGNLTFAGTNNIQFTGAGSRLLRISTPSTIIWTNSGLPQFTIGSGSITFDTNGFVIPVNITIDANPSSVNLLSNFTTSGTFSCGSVSVVLNSNILTCNVLTFGTATNPNINFGTGKIVCAGNYTGATGLTVTGTPLIELSSSAGGTILVSPVTTTVSSAISFKTTGSGTFTLNIAAGVAILDVDLTNHAGVFGTAVSSSGFTIGGALTLSSNASFSVQSGTGVISFKATSGPKNITPNGKTIDRPVTFDGVGGNWVLQGAMTLGSTRTLTHSNGTLNLNGQTLTAASYVTGTGTKNLTFNGGTLTVTNSGTTAFNNAVPTGFTTSAGTAKGNVYMTSSSAKTFVGGGSTYNATLVQAGAGALTISGSNTFSSIKNTTQPAPVTFTSSTTTTFVDDFKLKGAYGAFIVITASTAGTAATVSKSGVAVNCDYISVKDNLPAGGASWYAGAHSTLVSNYTGINGWYQRPPPSANTEFLTFLQ